MKNTYYDNTRLTDFKTCPRYFYFRHERDWIADTLRIPLAFGLAWHHALDVVWEQLSDAKNLRTQAVADDAFKAWLASWEESGLQADIDPLDDDFKMRNPGTALDMLYAYIDWRRPFFQEPSFKLLDIEHAFAVPLSSDPNERTFYVGRFDKVFSIRDHIYVGEHKISSLYKKDGGFRSNFLDSFSPNSQIDGYLYAAHMLYGDAAKAVWVDAALVHRSVHDAFTIIPVERQFAQLDAWLWETKYWIGQVEANRDLARLQGPVPTYLPTFGKNTNNCIDFGTTCPYMPLCKMFSNPEAQQETPMGFIEEHWSPFNVLGLKELDLEQGDD